MVNQRCVECVIDALSAGFIQDVVENKKKTLGNDFLLVLMEYDEVLTRPMETSSIITQLVHESTAPRLLYKPQTLGAPD